MSEEKKCCLKPPATCENISYMGEEYQVCNGKTFDGGVVGCAYRENNQKFTDKKCRCGKPAYAYVLLCSDCLLKAEENLQ